MTRDQILARKPRVETLDVPEWETTLHLHALTAPERMEWANGNEKRQAAGHPMLRNMTAMLIASARDETGTRIFQDEDAESLEQQEGAMLERIYAVVARLNGLDAEMEAATAKK